MRGDDDHPRTGIVRHDPTDTGQTFITARPTGGEVHVEQDQVIRATCQHREGRVGIARDVQAMPGEAEEDFRRPRHHRIIFDQQDIPTG